jgi:hypothetical protein
MTAAAKAKHTATQTAAEKRLAAITERGLLPFVEAACAQHYCTIADFLSELHPPHITAARRILVLQLRKAKWSYHSIAALLGRDHRSIMALAGARKRPSVRVVAKPASTAKKRAGRR